MPGTLHLVGTPIGNLGDITPRAVEVLRAVDRIYAEDTRRTRALLSALGIAGKPVSSLHAHSSDRTVTTAIEILIEGRDLALVTDAGMPSISDPGRALVRATRDAGIPITAAPGPSAVTTAIALSGLVEGPFLFLGFLPRKGRQRKDALRRVTDSDVPVVLFESPQRIADTLRELAELAADRPAAVCRELTKRFEEVRVGPLQELAARTDEWRGEITLVVAQNTAPSDAEPELDLHERIDALVGQGLSVKDIVGLLLRSQPTLSKRALYAQIQARMDERLEPDNESDEDDESDED